MADVTSMLQEAIEHYRPGGEFATVRGRQLVEKKGTAIAGAEAGLVGRGLAGTTVGMAIPAAFEQQIAAPWRTETEMMRGGRLMEAVLAQAGFAERESAREQQAALAKAQMALEEKLRNREISVQEYNAATARIAARGGGGGAVTPRRTMADIPSDAGAAVGAGDAGYGRHLLESLEYGWGTKEYEQAKTERPPWYSEQGVYTGAMETMAHQEEVERWAGGGAGAGAGVDYGPGSAYQREKYGPFGAAFPS